MWSRETQQAVLVLPAEHLQPRLQSNPRRHLRAIRLANEYRAEVLRTNDGEVGEAAQAAVALALPAGRLQVGLKAFELQELLQHVRRNSAQVCRQRLHPSHVLQGDASERDGPGPQS